MMGRRNASSTDAGQYCVMTGRSRAVVKLSLVAIVTTAISLWLLDGSRATPDASADESPRAEVANQARQIAARAAPRQPDAAVQSGPFSLAYVPRDVKVIAGVRTSLLRDSQALSSLNEFLAKDQKVEKELGIPLERVEQIVVIYFDDGDGSAALIFHLAREEDAASMLKAGQPDPEKDTFAGQAYLRRKNEGGKPNCVFADSKIVVVTQDEQHLRRLIIAGRKGASQAKWAGIWNATGGNDAVALINVRKLRSQQALQSPFNLAQLFLVFPAELAPLLELSTAVISIKAGDELQATARLAGTGSADLKKIHDATKGVIDLSQAFLSNERVEASGRPPAQTAHELGLIERIDGLLDTVEVSMNDSVVEASVVLTRDDVKSIIENVTASE